MCVFIGIFLCVFKIYLYTVFFSLIVNSLDKRSNEIKEEKGRYFIEDLSIINFCFKFKLLFMEISFIILLFILL